MPAANLNNSLADLSAAAFAPNGALSRTCQGYHQRPQQVEMARCIAEALSTNGTLAVEAGTGTGKTFAYLVPALLCGGKVIVSTGTRNLQDQLFDRDLPLVREALAVGGTIALLKGRANYVCRHRLGQALSNPHLLHPEEYQKLHHVVRFAKTDNVGERSNCTSLSEDDAVWGKATSTRDNCLSQKCPDYEDCFVMEARKKALAADVLVVNHHLFFADLALKEKGVNSILPSFNAVIFDEAHQLPDTASRFFSHSLSLFQLQELVRDVRFAQHKITGGKKEMDQAAAHLEKALRELRLAAGEGANRWSWSQWKKTDFLPEKTQEVLVFIEALKTELEMRAEQSEDIMACCERAHSALELLTAWQTLAEESDSSPWVHWTETQGRNLTFHRTPLSIADIFHEQRKAHTQAWIFTSATLAVADSFAHFLDLLGLKEARCERWESPYDFKTQALLYIPSHLPEPNAPHYIAEFVKALWPILQASRGRAFVLCTSLKAMNVIHQSLRELDEKTEFSWLLQGELPKSELLRRFLDLPQAVLVGSQSFWEGVDVRGAALSVVVIDRIPFAVPSDPVLSERLNHFRQQGKNPFHDYQLPEAALHLKQGAGRLIRDEADHGVLMVGDSRLIHKPYGAALLAALPPMRRASILREVEEFFEKLKP